MPNELNLLTTFSHLNRDLLFHTRSVPSTPGEACRWRQQLYRDDNAWHWQSVRSPLHVSWPVRINRSQLCRCGWWSHTDGCHGWKGHDCVTRYTLPTSLPFNKLQLRDNPKARLTLCILPCTSTCSYFDQMMNILVRYNCTMLYCV